MRLTENLGMFENKVILLQYKYTVIANSYGKYFVNVPGFEAGPGHGKDK